MLTVTNTASQQLAKALETDQVKGQHLVIYFQGVGWSGPSLGLALDESVDGLDKLESNGVTAYIDPGLKEFLEQYGGVNIDYVERTFGGGGYLVSAGKPGEGCGDCSCGWAAWAGSIAI